VSSVTKAGIASKWLNESSWFVARSLLYTSPALCYKEISDLPKINVLIPFPSRRHRYTLANISSGLPVEESIRMTQDIDKWRKYTRPGAPRIEDG